MPLISGFNRRAKNYLYFRVAVTFGEGGGGGGGGGGHFEILRYAGMIFLVCALFAELPSVTNFWLPVILFW